MFIPQKFFARNFPKKIIAALFFCALLFCCATPAPFIWDDTLTENNAVTLIFLNSNLQPVSYNGVTVKIAYRQDMIVPAGMVTLGVSARIPAGNINYTFQNAEIEYLFEGGKEYRLYGTYELGSAGKLIFGANISEIPAGETKEIPIGFAPFK